MERTLDERRANFWVGEWEGGWLLLPLIAVLGGDWAFSVEAPVSNGSLPLALALALVGWVPLWRALMMTDWATPLAQWHAWRESTSLPRWPYLQPGTPGAALYRAVGQALSWWRDFGRQTLLIPLRSGLFSLGVALLLSVALGRFALLLTLLFLTIAEFAVLWHEGRGQVDRGWEALALAGLPWMLGASLQGRILLPLASALVVTVLVGCMSRPGLWLLAGDLLGVLFLLWQGEPFAAGVLVLLTFPALWLAVNRVEEDHYRRVVVPWLFAVLLLFAGVL